MNQSERTFLLQSYEPDFYTGSCDNGQQAIMGLLCPFIVTYLFDADGNLSGARRQLWNHPAPRLKDDGPYDIYDPQFVQDISKQLQNSQKEIGFQNKAIRIKEFTDEEMGVGINELPEYLQDADPEEEEEEEEEMEESLLEWRESGNFALVWAKEYWVSDSGEVESTSVYRAA